jgi:hypothetical protein
MTADSSALPHFRPGMRLLLTAVLLSLASPAWGDFIQPRKAGDPLIYGVKNGIVVAVHPFALDARNDGGPRGLLRVGYEDDGRYYLINYIAVEPLVGRARGFSELEKGGDGRPGKRFWVSDDLMDRGNSKPGHVPGRVQDTPAGRVLTFVVHVEEFANGARPVVEVSFFEQLPERVRFRTYSAAAGARMKECVLTATMGNQSRCRWLWLRSKAIFAPALYAGYQGQGFVEKEMYGSKELHRAGSGEIVVAISPDEFEPREVWPFRFGAWRHDGRWMSQFWLKPHGSYDDTLHCRVNGRRVYWASDMPIPGGISYENFELREAFHPGRESWFGFTAASPAKLFGFSYDASPQAAPRRRVAKAEELQAAAAAKTSRTLRNGDFLAGLDGWQIERGAGSFRTIPVGKETALTTCGPGKETDTGRIYQCFQVPHEASELAFFLHGGSDSQRVYVALWQGIRLCRRMTARDSNTPFEVRWDVRPLRGQVVTLEIVDESTEPWGFLGAHGFTLRIEKQRPRQEHGQK